MQLVEEFNSESLRGRPVTAARFIAAVKYCFHDHYNVPQTVSAKAWQISILRGMYLEPLPGATVRKQNEFSISSANSMFALAADLQVNKLYPWMFSSLYTFAYFVIDRRRSDSLCKEAYNCMLKGDTPSTKVIVHVVNNVICKYGNIYAEEDEEHREGLTKKEIDNFLKLLGSSISREELKAFMIVPKQFIKSNYCDMEHEMCFFFKFFEINSNVTSTLSEDNNRKATGAISLENTVVQNRILTESLSYDYTEDCNDSDYEESSSKKSTYSLDSKTLYLQNKDHQVPYSCNKFNNLRNVDEDVMEVEEFSLRSSSNVEDSYIYLNKKSNDDLSKSITKHTKGSKRKAEEFFLNTNKKLNSSKDKTKKTNFSKFINKSLDFSNSSVKSQLTSSKKQSHKNDEESDILKNISSVNELNSSGSINYLVKSITDSTLTVQDITRPIIFALFRKYREWKMNKKNFKTNFIDDIQSEILQSSKKFESNSLVGSKASDSKTSTATSFINATNLTSTAISTIVKPNEKQIQKDIAESETENMYQSKNKKSIKMCNSFQCSICSLKFSRKELLMEHILYHDKKELQKVIYKKAVAKGKKRQNKLFNGHKKKKQKGSKSKKKEQKNKNLDSNKCSTRSPLEIENGIRIDDRNNFTTATNISISEHPIIHQLVPHVVDSNANSNSVNSSACPTQESNAEDRRLTKKLEESSTSSSGNKTSCNTVNADSVATEKIEVILLDDESSENSNQEQENLNQEQSQSDNKKQPYIRVRSITELQNKVHMCSVCDEIFYSLAAYERHKMQCSCTRAGARQSEAERPSSVQMDTPLALASHINETSMNESQKVLPQIRRQNQAEPVTQVSSNGMNSVSQISQPSNPQVQQQLQNTYWFVSCNGANT